MFSTNGWFVVKLNEFNLLYTYPQVIPLKPPWSTAKANWWMIGCQSHCPWGRARWIHRKRGKGKGGKEKTWKVEEEGAGAQDISLKRLLRSFGGGRKWWILDPDLFPDGGMPNETALAEVIRSSWGFQVFGSLSVWRTELESNRQIETTILIQNHTFKWTLPNS